MNGGMGFYSAWGSTPQEGQRGLGISSILWGLVISSLDRNGESYKRMNGVRKGKPCNGKESFLLSLLFLGSSLKDTVTSWKYMESEKSGMV